MSFRVDNSKSVKMSKLVLTKVLCEIIPKYIILSTMEVYILTFQI